MNQIRDILNKIKWQNEDELRNILIWYVHRGAPNNVKCITGDTIQSIGKTFLETPDGMIPHHRIFRILYNNTVVYERGHHRF